MEPARRTIVKVCGITRPADARAAVAAGAAWLGFILWDGSPRNVTPDRARAMSEPLEAAVAAAVRAAPAPDPALRTAARAGAERVQGHPGDPAAAPSHLPAP